MLKLCVFIMEKALINNIIIIIIHHQLGLDRPVSASSNSLFKGLPIRLQPNVLQFNITFAILLLFILVTCHSQFDLYLLGFLSTGSVFNSSKISSFLLWSTGMYMAVPPKIFISTDVSRFFILL